jgi:hypothetical protein
LEGGDSKGIRGNAVEINEFLY